MKMYHNPRGSKSRQTLQLLTEHGVEPEIIDYLNQPPSEKTLKNILQLLDLNPRELMRDKEAIYKEQGLADTDLSDSQLIKAMIKFPKLIERPIVIKGNQAVLGRPPENVLALLS